MKKMIVVLCFLLIAGISSGQPKKTGVKSTVPIPTRLNLKAEAWDFAEGRVSFIEHRGVAAIRMDEKSGVMLYKNLNFSDGTIEFDVEVNQPQPFPSLYFRWKDKDETEHVYLRTGVAGKRNAFDAVQYASIIKGVNLWDLQHEFQTAAEIKIKDWNHVRMVISGKQLQVYVNNNTDPVLEVPCMEGNTSDGRIGIGTGFPGQAIFANIIVTPGATEGLSPKPGADITAHDTRYIRNWKVSMPDSLNYGNELNAFMLPKTDSGWDQVQTERRGLVNLSRKFGFSSQRKYVWLTAKIRSEFNQVQTMKLGFSDEVWVFVNQRPVYTDKNIYYQNMRKSPNGRISIENSSFLLPLQKGDNDLIIGISNDFYGWGVMARLEHLEGIEVVDNW
ncbi:hypothetical protein [Pollutibacter soli]|uniref:hypothetical protein n=1 Tax=Pollutibacter soli TaxID=3034157 RepID=UPI003013C6C2